MNETLRQAAIVAGKHAGRTGQPVTACPYDPGSSDPVQRALAGAWVREYLRNRPVDRRVDYSDAA